MYPSPCHPNPGSPTGRTKRGCEHPFPLEVSSAEDADTGDAKMGDANKRARCFRCGASGPARGSSEEAIAALRAEGGET